MAVDWEEIRSVQKELRKAKNSYREKLESKMQKNSTKEVCDGLKRLSRH